jgi:diguanylate cyclase (GGDEF)-like protein
MGELTDEMRLYPSALLKTLVPAALISAAYVGLQYIQLLDADSRVILQNLPYVFCMVAIIMANQFNRGRLMLAALGVAIFYWTVQNYLQVSLLDSEASELYLALSLALPILTFYLLLLPERGIWNLYGVIFFLAFVFLGLVCIQLGPWLPKLSEAAHAYYASHPIEGYVLSLGSSLLISLVALLGVFLLSFRNEDVEAALLGAFVALYWVLALLHEEHISVAMSTAAALSLVWGLIRSSHAMAYRDELTGLPGRRALKEKLRVLGGNFSIAMLDIDHFKRVNDSYGHDVGDEVLKLVASRLKRVGGGGTAYRYGGEEFCIVFPRKDLEVTIAPLERVREEISNYTMSLRDRSLRPNRAKEGSRKRGATRLGSNHLSVTISIGIANRSAALPDTESVIAEADKKLYQAKKAGRNRLAF